MYQSIDTKIYEELADALNSLPNGFPRTPSNVEIPMLQKIFTPAEAALAQRYLIWFDGRPDNPRFRLAPFIVGIYEAQLHNMDYELVHTMSNVRDKSLFIGDVGYICNCCGCCCAILRGITDWGVENSVAQANYYSSIDAERYTACKLCEQRCQVGAISEQDGAFVVDTMRCIGCGLCVIGCPNDAAKLHPKPDDEIVPSPLDLANWERQRMQNRK